VSSLTGLPAAKRQWLSHLAGDKKRIPTIGMIGIPNHEKRDKEGGGLLTARGYERSAVGTDAASNPCRTQ